MITITDTIAIAIITIAVITITIITIAIITIASPLALAQMRTHTPTICGKQAADSAG